MIEQKHVDTLLPPDMALQAEQVGVNKANFSASKTIILAVLAGSFIALGAVFYTSVTTGSSLPYGLTRLIGGIAFSLGLVLVILGGAELFTGNNLIIMAWANKKISTGQLLRNWLLVYLGNMAGALFIVIFIFLSGQFMFSSGEVGLNMMKIAKAKCELGFGQAIILGILCNILVCLAVWLCFSALNTSGKILSIVFPVTAFIAAGFEHSIANMYLVPVAIFVKDFSDPAFTDIINASGQQFESVTWGNFLVHNLIPVTIGNIIGGAVLVGLVYWFVFLRKPHTTDMRR